MRLAATAPLGQRPTNLLFATVHYLLLRGVEHELMAFYPSVVGAAARDHRHAAPSFRSFCLEHRDALADLLQHRLVQTSVVRRSAALRYGLALLRQHTDRVHLFEVGASAGTHLCFDRYRYEVGGRVAGDPGSPVTLSVEWRGDTPVPDLDDLPVIASWFGMDLHPLDARDPDARL